MKNYFWKCCVIGWMCYLLLCQPVMADVNLPYSQAMLPENNPNALIISDFKKPILIHRNADTFIVALPANPTTGYEWFLMKYDRHKVQLVDSKYVPPQTNLMGAPGFALFTVKILPMGFSRSERLQLLFVYKRPWEKTIGQVQRVNIITQP